MRPGVLRRRFLYSARISAIIGDTAAPYGISSLAWQPCSQNNSKSRENFPGPQPFRNERMSDIYRHQPHQPSASPAALDDNRTYLCRPLFKFPRSHTSCLFFAHHGLRPRCQRADIRSRWRRRVTSRIFRGSHRPPSQVEEPSCCYDQVRIAPRLPFHTSN
jgi:hypothetical protein